ncbi:MAG TPA: PhoH family protein [Planctomycetaceae bacterium]|nr:PhoH family protein [Planctomycetaceae bacterium]HCD01930.1 PhoH family protein [Planctomycetaceae bacterium]
MSEASIPFDDPEEIRTLLGARDEHLRRVRDSVGVDVVIRDDALKIQGDRESVDQGVAVIRRLREVIGESGELRADDVLRALGQVDRPVSLPDFSASERDGDSDRRSRIELFESAKDVRPKTPGQEAYVDAIRRNDLVFCTGPAGSGKTYLAVAMALSALRSELVRKIVLVRPAVEAGEKLGFLPGDVTAKVNPYLRPLLDALADILSYDQVKRYIEHDVVEIVPLAFMRGRTLNETFIILDEAQNATRTQMQMFLTRMGQGSKIVVTGDITQVDLPDHLAGGLPDAIKRLTSIDGVDVVRLRGRDIVRHRLVSEIVKAYTKTPSNGR